MDDQRTFFLKEINHICQNSLLNITLLQKYKQLSQRCLINDFHVLFNMKSFKIKLTKIQEIAQRLASITDFTVQEVTQKLNASKKTDLSKFMTEILFPDASSLLLLEQKRKQLILKLRTKGTVQFAQYKLFKIIYYVIYCFQSNMNPIQKLNNQETQNIKKILISLKKTMGLPNKSKNCIRNNLDNYAINLDVKKVISIAAKQLQESEQGAKVSKLLTQSENKKWLGPRLYKIIRGYNWDYITIRKFIDSLTKVNINHVQLRSKASTVKKVIKKVLINLRKYAASINKKRQFKKVIKKQRMEDQKQFNESIFLPDLLPLQHKIPSTLKNGGLSQQFDFYQFLIKSDEGTIFQKLCEQNNNPLPQ